MRAFASLALAAAGLVSMAQASITNPVDPLVIKGSKFFYKTNGTQFYMKGVAYQQDYSGNGSTSTSTSYTDPLADETSCKRDVPYLVELGTNIIRTYAIDPTQDHDACMQLLNDAGIYVISDLSDPSVSINRNDPQWDLITYSRYTSVVDAMSGYSNVVGFFAGNEVSNSENTTAAAAFVKAAVRDTKAYISAKGYRAMGVGYATNDDASIRVQEADYFNCGNQTDAIDFWGYNIYSWCGDSNYIESGYQTRTEEFSNYSVPVFFAEYGCNDPSPRTFTEVLALYGTNMTPVFSGGIVYMYFQEANDYGLVSVDGNSVSTLADFTNLKSQLAKVTPTGVTADSYTPTNSAQACPTGDGWEAVNSPLPPTPDATLCDCMVASLECTIASDVSSDDYSTLFDQVCGYTGSPCAGINTNYTEGAYGAYGMCNASQQLAYAFNAYYKIQSKSADACSFGGSATLTSSASATGTCSVLLAEAGTSGTGVVSSGETAASSTSSGLGAPMGVHHVTFGGSVGFGVYLLAALVSGAAMILL